MIEIEVDGFSGPLDLLCHMIETGEMAASGISALQVVRTYEKLSSEDAWASIDSAGSFIVQAARLVLNKAVALMPKKAVPEEHDEDNLKSEDMEMVLERYRPYRKAAMVLLDLQSSWSLRSFRPSKPLPPDYDLGDLYSLSSLWWELMTKGNKGSRAFRKAEAMAATDIPSPIPDSVRIERRMEVIMKELGCGGLTLASALAGSCHVADLVVTVLALLELSRRALIRLEQKEIFGDVFILPRR